MKIRYVFEGEDPIEDNLRDPRVDFKTTLGWRKTPEPETPEEAARAALEDLSQENPYDDILHCIELYDVDETPPKSLGRFIVRTETEIHYIIEPVCDGQ